MIARERLARQVAALELQKQRIGIFEQEKLEERLDLSLSHVETLTFEQLSRLHKDTRTSPENTAKLSGYTEIVLLRWILSSFNRIQAAQEYWSRLAQSQSEFVVFQVQQLPVRVWHYQQVFRVGLRDFYRVAVLRDRARIARNLEICSRIKDMYALAVCRVAMNVSIEQAEAKTETLLGICQGLDCDMDGLLVEASLPGSRSLGDVLERMKRLQMKHSRLYDTVAPPGLWLRLWLPVAGVCVGGFCVSRLAFRYSSSLFSWLCDVFETSRDFLFLWIVAPLHSIYRTVRHQEQRLAILGTDSLRSDLVSLERMVVDFARDHGVSEETELESIALQVQRGDLSQVMQHYEAEIRSPVRNLLLGNLVRALFIQIQKAKVDGELAMSALDKLLKSNELNFAVLAFVPSLLLSWAAIRFLARKAASLSGNWHRASLKTLRFCLRLITFIVNLRDIERFLNLSGKDKGRNMVNGLSPTEHGYLVIQLNNLRSYISKVPLEYRSAFLQDIRDLEDDSTPTERKLNVVNRMWRTFPFLR